MNTSRVYTSRPKTTCTSGCPCIKHKGGLSFNKRCCKLDPISIPVLPPDFFTENSFVTQWQTNSLTIRLPLPPGTTYDVLINWGDGVVKGYSTSASWVEHTYAKHGLYTISLTGSVRHWDMLTMFNDSGIEFTSKLRNVVQFGKVGLTKLNFAYATNITTFAAKDVPESTITDMSSMFLAASQANPDVSKWDTSNVTNMLSMFTNASQANPNVSKWNTGKATNMSAMFSLASLANPNVSDWDVSKVTDMSFMFFGASVANPVVSSWITSNVENMSFMFTQASQANPDVTSWDTSKVESMIGMFFRSKFNRDLSAWNFSALTTVMDDFVRECDLDQANYDLLVQSITDTVSPGADGTTWIKPIGNGSLNSNGTPGPAMAAVDALRSPSFMWTIQSQP